MHIGICDDEIAELQSLKRMIESYCDAHGLEAEIHLFASGVELLSESEHLDLLFLDIAMPGVDGIEAGKRFRKRNPRCKIAMETCREGPDTGGLLPGGLPVSAKTPARSGCVGSAGGV